MASHLEMLRVAQDPPAVRLLAKRLLALPSHAWGDWEVDFLGNMAAFDGPEPISLRQREVLFELRDDTIYLTHYRGLSIAALIRNCVERHADLTDERDASFILKLKGHASIQRRKLGRLLRCCRELGEIERYM